MEALYPEIVVAGCGNPLYADDGFGIAVVESLQGLELPVGSYRDAHSWGLTEPLQRIKDDIKIRVLVCQKKYVSAPEMVIGITDEVERAIPGAVSEILKEIG